MSPAHLVFFERCLDSNPESCRIKQARYQLSHPTNLVTYLPTNLATQLPNLATRMIVLGLTKNLKFFFEVVSWWAIVFGIFSAVKLETYWRNIPSFFWSSSKSHSTLSNNIFKWPQLTPIDFYEQANHIRGPWTNFTFYPRALNSLLTFSNFENYIGARRVK